METLNLYACLGGNRLLWNDCQVTAVESDPYLCELYQERFPDDIVICADAHEYLLHNYQKFDFIWSSPPCPTHSRARKANPKAAPVYPDLKLYEEIIFLQHYFNGYFCVENVVPYYDVLIPAQRRGRHLYWCNFLLPLQLSSRKHADLQNMSIDMLSEFHKFDFRKYKGDQRIIKIARNLVDFEAGKTIFEAAKQIYVSLNHVQMKLW